MPIWWNGIHVRFRNVCLRRIGGSNPSMGTEFNNLNIKKMELIKRKVKSDTHKTLKLETTTQNNASVVVTQGKDSVVICEDKIEEFINKLREVVVETKKKKAELYF